MSESSPHHDPSSHLRDTDPSSLHDSLLRDDAPLPDVEEAGPTHMAIPIIGLVLLLFSLLWWALSRPAEAGAASKGAGYRDMACAGPERVCPEQAGKQVAERAQPCA